MGIIFKSLLKHWRGEYGLLQSFFIHGIFPSVLLMFSINPLANFLGQTIVYKTDYLGQVLLSLSILILPSLYIWIGVWMSAYNTIKRDAGGIFAFTAIGLISIGFILATPTILISFTVLFSTILKAI